MWVGAVEHGGTNKAGSGPRYAAMETSGDVLGSPSLQGVLGPVRRAALGPRAMSCVLDDRFHV